jgi:hypothetical protein
LSCMEAGTMFRQMGHEPRKTASGCAIRRKCRVAQYVLVVLDRRSCPEGRIPRGSCSRPLIFRLPVSARSR